jgi:hypothetical protein
MNLTCDCPFNKMPMDAMPGFAFISGIFDCYNHRILDPRKPKTVTFDAEIPIGESRQGQLECVKGAVHYFVPSHEKTPIDDRKYFISGKVVSISQTDAEEKNMMDYDVQIEALTVCFPHCSVWFLHVYCLLLLSCHHQFFLMDDVDDPPKSQVIIAGQVRALP